MTGRGGGWFAARWAALRRRKRDEARDEHGTPWMFDASTSRSPAPRTRAHRDAELVAALGRVADTFARIADGLDADRRERRAQFEADRDDRSTQLDAVEYLLREMAIGVRGATAEPPIVVGGSIEPDSIERTPTTEPRELQIDLSEAAIDEDSHSEG